MPLTDPSVYLGLLILLVEVHAVLALGSAVALRWAAARPAAQSPSPPAWPRVTIIVAARDEEALLPGCLDALAAQDYPPDRLRILVADDHSTDRTAAIIQAAARRDPRIRYLTVPPPEGHLVGKANALHAAIRHAESDLLLLTDADCTPPPLWARHLVAQFEDERLGLCCGVTVVAEAERGRRLSQVQALDWLYLLAVAAAASAAGVPVTAMGNNMALRRAAYDAVGGYAALPASATEDYALFQAIHRQTPWRVRLLADAALLNVTAPLPTLRAAWRQRRRWARGGLRARWWTYGLYGFVFLLHAGLLAALLLAPLTASALLAVKLTADAVLLGVARRRLEAPVALRPLPFLLFELYLFGYVVALPLSFLIAPRIGWRGRHF